MGFALLVDVFFRWLFEEPVAWDLLGIVILGGLVAMLYQIHHKVTLRSWIKVVLLAVVAALIVAIVVFLVLLRMG